MTAGIILGIQTPPSVSSTEGRKGAWDKLATDFLTHADTTWRLIGGRQTSWNSQVSGIAHDIKTADELQLL